MDLVDSLYARLRHAIDREPGGADTAALTVADVYQRLVPYRGVRGELSILELAEYEHALVRLLAGERGYVEMEDSVQAELRSELSSPNPILGVYRDYAAAPVRLVAGLPAAADPPSPRPTDQTAEAPPPPPRRTPAPAPPMDETSPLPDPHRPARAEPGGQHGGVTPFDACVRCGEALPDDEDLRFCPACGADQQSAACARCGAALKPDWNFCVRCGNPRDTPPPAL